MESAQAQGVNSPPTRRRIFAVAVPIIAANAASPLLGIVDTAVLGHWGSAQDLGGIALGALLLSFLYWTFGFLRMGTTGFVAQCVGAGDEPELRATVARSLLLALTAALLLVAFARPLARIGLELLSASPGVAPLAATYVEIRSWGAPATLASFALVGTLLGLAESRRLLVLQLVLNGMNAALDLWFAGHLGWGLVGIAWGTVISEWLALGLGAWMVFERLRGRHHDGEAFVPWARLRDLARLRAALLAHTDIMLRTLLLLLGFGLFNRQGAKFGDLTLAANHILLQFVSFAAFFLDGFAFAAEAFVGAAVGSGRRDTFDRAVRSSTELAVGTAWILALGLLLGGDLALALLTDLPEVRDAASRDLSWAALYVAVAVWAFQLDGIFIGATRTRDMRNAAALSLAVFVVAMWWTVPSAGNHGLWQAFLVYAAARAGALACFFPRLRRSIPEPPATPCSTRPHGGPP